MNLEEQEAMCRELVRYRDTELVQEFDRRFLRLKLALGNSAFYEAERMELLSETAWARSDAGKSTAMAAAGLKGLCDAFVGMFGTLIPDAGLLQGGYQFTQDKAVLAWHAIQAGGDVQGVYNGDWAGTGLSAISFTTKELVPATLASQSAQQLRNLTWAAADAAKAKIVGDVADAVKGVKAVTEDLYTMISVPVEVFTLRDIVKEQVGKLDAALATARARAADETTKFELITLYKNTIDGQCGPVLDRMRQQAAR